MVLWIMDYDIMDCRNIFLFLNSLGNAHIHTLQTSYFNFPNKLVIVTNEFPVCYFKSKLVQSMGVR